MTFPTGQSVYDHHFGEPCLVHGTTCFLHIDLCYAHNPFPSMTILGHHLVSDEVVCDSATFSLRSHLFPFHQVVCVKVDVKWDLQARCEPFIDVVEASGRSLVFTREVSW